MSDFDLREFQIFMTAPKPALRDYVRHFVFFLIAFVTVTIAGTLYPFGILPIFANVGPEVSATDFALHFPAYYAQTIGQTVMLMFREPEVLAYGLKFSISLLFVLLCHEFGHYFACRRYGVDSTLPYFIPTPPLLGPAGTFGAFIKIRSPLPSRRATFDIGVAGPIAGFVALLPIAVTAFATFQSSPEPLPAEMPEGLLVFSDPLIFHGLAFLFGIDLSVPMLPNPFYSAAWLGLLITALNLIPSGQLDGGHAVFAVFGPQFHHWLGRAAFIAMLALSLAGLFFFNSPAGILFAVLMGFLLRFKHPVPLENEPLGNVRIAVAVLTLIIFVLSFVPFPIRIT